MPLLSQCSVSTIITDTKTMRSMCVLAMSIATAVCVTAQIPNGSFEEWSTTGSYEDPDGWATMNFLAAGPFYSCTKSTDHYPSNEGAYSIRLENNTSLTQMTGSYGMAVTNAFDYPFKPAFAVPGHPEHLTGAYKFSPQNNDTMFIRIVLFDEGTNIGVSTLRVGAAAADWTTFSLALPGYTTADSATIQISAFYPTSQTDGPNGNSVLQVDDLGFDDLGVTVHMQASASERFRISTDPAGDKATLQIGDGGTADVTVRLFSVSGALAGSETIGRHQRHIAIGALRSGCYLAEIVSGERVERQGLVIRR